MRLCEIPHNLFSIDFSSELDCEDSEKVEPTVKRNLPKGLNSMSMEDWDLRLIYFVRMLTLKKWHKSVFFLLF